ncbi:MAG TPA: hypothetical protein VFA45_19770, partial [Actinomycetes bacterium]|nr:hypothetical protein [Actinomycetes bacterium]
ALLGCAISDLAGPCGRHSIPRAPRARPKIAWMSSDDLVNRHGCGLLEGWVAGWKCVRLARAGG